MKIGLTATIVCVGRATITRRGPTFSFCSCSSNLDRSVTTRPRVSPRCAKFAFNPRPSDFINEIDSSVLCTCLIDDPVDSTSMRLTHSDRIRRATQCHVTCKLKSYGNIVPHGKNNGKTHVYKVGRNNVFALPPQLSN